MSGGGSTFLLKGILAVLVPCNIMRCFAISISYGFVCSSGEKRSDDLHLAIPWCVMEWGITNVILGVDLSSCLNQDVDHLHMAFLWCTKEWGDTLPILLIDISACLNQSVHLKHMAICWCHMKWVERVGIPEEESIFNKYSYTFQINLHTMAKYFGLIGTLGNSKNYQLYRG